jgi:hypothetical protein
MATATENAEMVTALTLANQEKDMAVKQTRAQLAEAKKNGPALPKLVDAAITTVVAGTIGLIVGGQHGGDEKKKEAQMGYAAGAALVGGGMVAVFTSNSPKIRSGATDVATAGAAILAFQMGEREGVQMALQAEQARAKAQASAPAGGQVGGYRKS